MLQFHYLAFFERLSDGTTFEQYFNDIHDLDVIDYEEYHLCEVIIVDD